MERANEREGGEWGATALSCSSAYVVWQLVSHFDELNAFLITNLRRNLSRAATPTARIHGRAPPMPAPAVIIM